MKECITILPAVRMLLMEGETGILQKQDAASADVALPADAAGAREAVADYQKQHGALPKTVSVEGAGVYGFVNEYNPHLRLSEKIAIVTGSAQGFGAGIAEAMLQQGAYVVIADLNFDLAQNVAAEFCKTFGAGRAMAVRVDVSDEQSVKDMVEATVLQYGGLDIFVNNAGVVKAGSLEEMDLRSFEFVTKINYTAYFLCTKYAVVPMKAQTAVKEDYFCDVIQINSKSGLSGSNKNFAYAGSKFGGIGLTQSFALELTPYNIKVNSICPGNFLGGPLWTDPENGLFVQYLRSGKVPGAKNVDDVRRFYESKVPMNRGCECDDVARALFYVVEQKYETGQAIPVTGGQSMLK